MTSSSATNEFEDISLSNSRKNTSADATAPPNGNAKISWVLAYSFILFKLCPCFYFRNNTLNQLAQMDRKKIACVGVLFLVNLRMVFKLFIITFSLRNDFSQLHGQIYDSTYFHK
jgi:hypothetical protein